MGSLLKEYLNVAYKQDELPDATESSDKDILTAEKKDTSMDNVIDINQNSSHELENGEGASRCLENGGQEPQSEVQKSCTSEDGSSFVPQFKNIVAIVDPPRGGLHPIVSKILLLSCLQFSLYQSLGICPSTLTW